jgi:hypothetical protein
MYAKHLELSRSHFSRVQVDTKLLKMRIPFLEVSSLVGSIQLGFKRAYRI